MKTVISAKDAKSQGLLRYHTGKPCKHGHVDDRLVSNGTCCECNKLKVLKWQQENPDKTKRNHDAWVQRNPGVAAKRANDWYNANIDRHREQVKKYHASKPHFRALLSSKARASQLQRTPSWLTEDDWWMIDQIYQLAQLRTAATSVEWHVDHIIPLRGKTVSGLHVPANLRVIPAKLNLKKGNRYAADPVEV